MTLRKCADQTRDVGRKAMVDLIYSTFVSFPRGMPIKPLAIQPAVRTNPANIASPMTR